MRLLMTVVLALSVTATAQVRQGRVSGLQASTDASGTVHFTIRGANPCSGVQMDFGDGTSITYPVRELPVTISRDYARAGTFAASARGVGDCVGTASASVRVTTIQQRTWPSTPEPAARRASIRFAAMDANGDGIITRNEWRGSARSFANHDWNGDGRLSDEEVRLGSARPSKGVSGAYFSDWTETRFRALDRNGDNRLTRAEWRFDLEDFFRADRNGDNVLEMNEFLIGDEDDDRGDRFDDLDLNSDNVIDWTEWHGSSAAFRWLDRNNNGVISRVEAIGVSDVAGSRAAGVRDAPRSFVVSSRQQWKDTGIALRIGDEINIQASGRINFSRATGDVAAAAGAAGRPATPAAPLPYSDIGALIARIGNNEPFIVGTDLTGFRVQQAGRLFLGVNDDVLDDNSGEFRATVTVVRR